jgi:predicted dehydrogenase
MLAMRSRKVRWGILGTANIARKNWKAIHLTGNSIITAVASRDRERSRRFIAECQAEVSGERVPEALGSYAELLAGDRVDAVCIPLPTGLRKEWVLAAATAGKHVVCEKPCEETNLFRNFADQVLSGRLNPLWPAAALKTQLVMSACLESARADGRRIRLDQ